MWQKENQDINGFFKITQNASLVKVLTATLADGLEITGNQYTEVGGSLYLHVFQPITFFFSFDSDRSESLSGALDGCYSYDGAQNQWNLYATLEIPRYRFSHVMINKDTMWITGIWGFSVTRFDYTGA